MDEQLYICPKCGTENDWETFEPNGDITKLNWRCDCGAAWSAEVSSSWLMAEIDDEDEDEYEYEDYDEGTWY